MFISSIANVELAPSENVARDGRLRSMRIVGKEAVQAWADRVGSDRKQRARQPGIFA